MSSVSYIRNASATIAGGSGATLVQHRSETFASAAANDLAFTSPVTTGNALFVAILNTFTGATGITVTDTLGNTYTQLEVDTGDLYDVWIFATDGAFTGANTVTVTCDDAGIMQIYLLEYNGVSGTGQDNNNNIIQIPSASPIEMGPFVASQIDLMLSFIMTDVSSTFSGGGTETQTVIDTQNAMGFSSAVITGVIPAAGSGISCLLNTANLGGSGIAALTTVNNITGSAGPTGLTIEFAENNPGDTCIVAFMATSSAADFVAAPSTIIDSENNVYTLAASLINHLTSVSAVYTAQFIYMCAKVAGSAGAVTIDMPSSIVTAGIVNLWGGGSEYQANFATIKIDDVVFNGGFGTTITDLVLTMTGTDDIVLMGYADSGLNSVSGSTIQFQPFADILNDFPTQNALLFSGPAIAAIGGLLSNEMSASTTVVVEPGGAVTDMFAFAIAFIGTNNTGGSAAETLTFSLNKGPAPIIPIEGRAIATVQIDCTQQISHSFGLPIDYPEFAAYPFSSLDATAFIVIEFDLEHLFQGAGLSEMRSLMAWSRPWFRSTNGVPPRFDVPVNNLSPNPEVYPALLTNTTTLQTVILGGSNFANQSWNGPVPSSFGETMIVPFPANKHSLKYRFIQPLSAGNAANPVGKYNLQFCNYEISPFISNGILSRTT